MARYHVPPWKLKTGLSLKSRSALLEASPGFGRCFKNTVSLQSISWAQTVNNLLMPFCRIFLKTCHPHYLLAAVSHYSRWKMLYLSVRLVLCNFSPLTQESTQARGNKMQSRLFFFPPSWLADSEIAFMSTCNMSVLSLFTEEPGR